jgi:hypothetical protein
MRGLDGCFSSGSGDARTPKYVVMKPVLVGNSSSQTIAVSDRYVSSALGLVRPLMVSPSGQNAEIMVFYGIEEDGRRVPFCCPCVEYLASARRLGNLWNVPSRHNSTTLRS